MRTKSYDPDALVKLFEGRKIATMVELKEALGTDVAMTVFRKLRELGYATSYSHCGKYYALLADLDFDARGLWSLGGVRFSKHGTLLETVRAFVTDADAGWYREELEDTLGVGVKEALLRLVRRERVSRERLSGRWLYCSSEPGARGRQRTARGMAERGAALELTDGAAVPDELKAAIVLFASALDEKQRRLYAGLESLKVGHGGDRRIAEATGMDVHTVARGRRELLGGAVDTGRVRTAGGGRKRVEKKRRK